MSSKLVNMVAMETVLVYDWVTAKSKVNFKSLYLHFYLTYRVVTGTIGKLNVRTIEMSHHGSHANISGMC